MSPLAIKIICIIILVLAIVPLMLYNGLSEPFGTDGKVQCGDNPECNYVKNVGFLISIGVGIFIGVTALLTKTINNPPNIKSIKQRNHQIKTIFTFLIFAGLWWGIAFIVWLGIFGFINNDFEGFLGLIGVCVLLVILLILYRLIVGKDFDNNSAKKEN